MPTRFRVSVLLLAICFVFSPRLASAQMTLTISNPSLFASPGDTVTFFGTFTNTSLTDTYEITSTQIRNLFFMNPGSTQLSVDSSSSNIAFQAPGGIPLQFAPGDTFTGGIFSITISSSAAPGAYPQLTSLSEFLYTYYDVTTSTSTPLNEISRNLSITVVPEPSTTGILATALGGFGIFARRVRRHDSASPVA